MKTNWVIVLVSEHGVSIYGDRDGEPFTSKEEAERELSHYPAKAQVQTIGVSIALNS